LYRVVSPFLLPTGDLAIPLREAQSIRLFGTRGQYLRTLGRQGEGPGEFRALDAAWCRGDSIEAYDRGLQRITRFAPDGRIAAVVSLKKLPGAPSGLGTYAGGWVTAPIINAGYGMRDQMAVYYFRPDGKEADQLATLLGLKRDDSPGPGLPTGPGILSPRAVFRFVNGKIYMAETGTPQVRIIDVGTRAERVFRWNPGTLPTPSSARAAVIDSLVARSSNHSEARRRYQQYTAQDPVPAFWDFLVDDLGYIWVLPFSAGKSVLLATSSSSGGVWRVFSPAGRDVGRVRVPAGLQPVQVTANAIVGIFRDADGVESVHVHRLLRKSAS
jgi:hypothetical protein